MVEIHWRLACGEASLFQPQMAWFWQSKETWGTGPSRFDILSNSAHLLFLCAHLGLQHGIGKGLLIWLVDIFYLQNRAGDTIAWDDFVLRAKIFGWSASSLLCFRCSLRISRYEFSQSNILSIALPNITARRNPCASEKRRRAK